MLKQIEAFVGLPDTHAGPGLVRGSCTGLASDGSFLVLCRDSLGLIACDALAVLMPTIQAGDEVLVWRPASSDCGRPVLIGKIGRVDQGDATKVIDVVAQSSLTLRCGQSSIEMHADGKVLIKGDDVTVKAKGTQRIRAGSVSIN